MRKMADKATNPKATSSEENQNNFKRANPLSGFIIVTIPERTNSIYFAMSASVFINGRLPPI